VTHKTYDQQIELVLANQPDNRFHCLAGDEVDLDRDAAGLGFALGALDRWSEAMARFVLFFFDFVDARGEQR